MRRCGQKFKEEIPRLKRKEACNALCATRPTIDAGEEVNAQDSNEEVVPPSKCMKRCGNKYREEIPQKAPRRAFCKALCPTRENAEGSRRGDEGGEEDQVDLLQESIEESDGEKCMRRCGQTFKEEIPRLKRK